MTSTSEKDQSPKGLLVLENGKVRLPGLDDGPWRNIYQPKL